MPKKPIDYSKALIYSIVCMTDETLIYVGSTTNFRERKNLHKKSCNNEKNRDHNTQVYAMIRANGGWDSFKISPIKEFPCENKIQLIIEEERIRKEMKANLNTRRAYRTQAERMEYNKDWHKANAEHVAGTVKKYYEANIAKIAEDSKKYREANAAKINENNKKYQKANPAKIAEYKKQYYQANKERIAERRKIKYYELKNAL